MLYWLDGRTNTRQRPQENYARELMELFTFGVGFYTEADVYAGARVFTGLEPPTRQRADRGQRSRVAVRVLLQRRAARHDREDLQLPDLRGRVADDSGAVGGGRDAGRHRPHHRLRPASRDGHGASRDASTAFFVSELQPAPDAFVERVASALHRQRLQHQGDRAGPSCTRRSSWTTSARFARYAWPVEFVVRAIKETGWIGLLGERRPDAARQHGAATVRAA